MLPQSGAPYTKKNIEKIEMIQRRAARWDTNDYSPYSSVSNMLSNLGWLSLENSRYDARLITFYKVVHGLVAITVPSYFEQPKRYTRHMHPLSFRQIHTSVCFYKYSFFPMNIVLWNYQLISSRFRIFTPLNQESVRSIHPSINRPR